MAKSYELDWSDFTEDVYNELVTDLKNHNDGGKCFAVTPKSEELGDYQIEIRIKPFGTEPWALDADLYDKKEDEVRPCTGCYEDCLLTYEQFKIAAEYCFKYDVENTKESSERPYQVVMYDRAVGTDDGMGFADLGEAIAEADKCHSGYVGTYGDWETWDGACVINDDTKKIEYTVGYCPLKEMFTDEVLLANGMEPETANAATQEFDNDYDMEM